MTTGFRWQAQGLHSGLGWLLLASVVLSAWVLLVPQPSPDGVVEASTPDHSASRTLHTAVAPAPAQTALPSTFKPAFEPTDFDPFAGVNVIVAQPMVQAAAAMPVTMPAPPSPTVRSALEARFAGRVVDPEGHQTIYLTLRDQTVVASVGLQLPGGFVIESISPTEVRVRPQGDDSQQSVTIPVPRTDGEAR